MLDWPDFAGVVILRAGTCSLCQFFRETTQNVANIDSRRVSRPFSPASMNTLLRSLLSVVRCCQRRFRLPFCSLIR